MNRSVLIPAAENAGLEYSEAHLKRMVSADIEEKTQLINVHVTGSSPEECLNFAAEIARQAPAYVEGIIEGTSMKIVSDPVTTGRSVYPDVRKNTAIGGAAGFAVTFLILLILMISDTKVKDIKELEDLYEVPAVGTIPRIGERGARNA
jgi:capsular polysaccharide biosynthesis protein